MNRKIIISDTGPLIAFAKINFIDILLKLFHPIILTENVVKECLSDLSRPDAQAIQHAIKKNKIKVHSFENNQLFFTLSNILGEGEASAITLALELKATLLIDEKLGRQVAENNKLKIIGTAGVLLLAKKSKLIEKVGLLIDNLKQSGYFFSEGLILEILTRSGEA